RRAPREFEDAAVKALPMLLCLRGVGRDALEALKEEHETEHEADVWDQWINTAAALDGAEFRFSKVERGEVWSVIYTANFEAATAARPQAAPTAAAGATGAAAAAAAPAVTRVSARLELVLDPMAPEWRVVAEAPLRRGVLRNVLLAQPLLRRRLDPSAAAPLLAASGSGWEVCLPGRRAFDVTVRGRGALVPSWRAALGLKHCDGPREVRWDRLEVTVPADAAGWLDGDVAGVYKLLPRCGTAQAALHIRSGGCGGGGGRPTCMFMDPTRSGDCSQDGFVFARAHRALAYGEQRVRCTVNGRWTPLPQGSLQAIAGAEGGSGAIVAVPLTAPTPKLAAAAAAGAATAGATATKEAPPCAEAASVLRCEVKLSPQSGAAWPVPADGHWIKVDLQRSHAKFEALAWLVRRWTIPEPVRNWSVGAAVAPTGSIRCAPSRPQLKWVNDPDPNKVRKRAREDYREAGRYEQALKARPEAFVVQLRRDGDVGQARIAVNVASLAHRALACLPRGGDAGATVAPAGGAVTSFSWRLTEHLDHAKGLPVLRVPSNKSDVPAAQPPHFRPKVQLRPEQLRSLTWMQAQEAATVPFVEEEVAEAVLGPLGWRVEVRAERKALLRGGIVADEVGYGKTAITLGLIDSRPQSAAVAPPPRPAAVTGRVPVKATLIVVPSHLMGQWPEEVKKFTGDALKVAKIMTLNDLNRLTVRQIEELDVCFVAVQVLRTETSEYYPRLARLAGVATAVPTKAGRHFDAVYAEALAGLATTVQLLDTTGAPAAWKRVSEARAAAEAAARKAAEEEAARQAALKRKQPRNKTAKASTVTAAAVTDDAADDADGEDNDASAPATDLDAEEEEEEAAAP
ncbi:unnamed protein product, partial [Phaeothamnion confervicola]